jgi:DNA-binding CsgD family transcriptional regulator
MSDGVGAPLERERELGTLRESLARAVDGEGTLLLVEGAAGVGKTVLMREARAAAQRAGITALEARGSELERQFAFGVVRQLLEPVVNGAVAPADMFAGAAGPSARLFEPDEQLAPRDDAGFEALHSLYWLLVNLADRVPVLVLVDDCQWVDPDSMRFLAYSAQRIEGLPVAIVLAGRPADSGVDLARSPWAQLAARPAAITLYPQPLSESAAVSLARQRLGAEAADEFCRACHTATGGNPLFLRELLRALDAAGVVPSSTAANEVQSVGPAAVRRFVLHRLATLGPSATELARAVAVLGDDCELRLASRVSGLDEAAARAAADDLVRADIFVHAERLGFVHPIVRAALYEELAPSEQQTRHAEAADALAADGASAERVTAHLLLTAPTGDERRIATLRSAATSAARRGAPREAAARLRRALAEAPAEQERAEILADLGSYEMAAMQFEAAEEHLGAALASRGDRATRADAASTLARCTIVSGGRSADTTADALASLAEEFRPLDRERSLKLGAELLMVTTVVPRLRPDLGSRLNDFRDQARGHSGYEAVARIHLAQEQLFRAGSAADAVADVQAAFTAGLPPTAQTGAMYLALQALQHAESYDLAGQVLDVALEGARREGHATRQGLIHAQRAAIALARGSLADAQVETETGLHLLEPPHFAVLHLLATAIVVHVERGEFDVAADLADMGDALGLAEDRPYIAEFLVARGRLRTAQGRVEEGVADLQWCGRRLEALELLWPGEWRVYLAPALASLGENEPGARIAHEQLALARQVGAPAALGRSLRAAGLALGGAEALALHQEAVSTLEPSAARLDLAHAFADLGAELNRSGRRREGRDAQREAIRLADECGAVALSQSARAALQAGPGRRARIELTGPSALTAAEWRVCSQAADGRTNREIAQALFVTEKTVERHLGSAYQKLRIRSRFQLPAAIGK